MAKAVDMSKYDEFEETLEEYLNKQGCTLGKEAERLEKLKHSITYCYIHGVLTDSQVKQANEKFIKQFKKALYEMGCVGTDCVNCWNTPITPMEDK